MEPNPDAPNAGEAAAVGPEEVARAGAFVSGVGVADAEPNAPNPLAGFAVEPKPKVGVL